MSIVLAMVAVVATALIHRPSVEEGSTDSAATRSHLERVNAECTKHTTVHALMDTRSNVIAAIASAFFLALFQDREILSSWFAVVVSVVSTIVLLTVAITAKANASGLECQSVAEIRASLEVRPLDEAIARLRRLQHITRHKTRYNNYARLLVALDGFVLCAGFVVGTLAQ